MEKIIIAAMSLNHVIGSNGKIPWNIPEDRVHFKELTKGHPVIMGRKTFESIIGSLGKPLGNGRTNLVVTHDYSFYEEHNGGNSIIPCSSIDDAFKKAEQLDSSCYIAGGGEIYRQTIDYADKMELTIVNGLFYGDTSFPRFKDEWEKTKSQGSSDDLYFFVTYKRRE